MSNDPRHATSAGPLEVPPVNLVAADDLRGRLWDLLRFATVQLQRLGVKKERIIAFIDGLNLGR